MDTRTSPLIDKANDVKQDLSELGSLAVDAARETAGQMKNGAVDMYEKGCAQAKSVQTQTENYIKKEPLKALLIAGAAGFALGWLISRRWSK